MAKKRVAKNSVEAKTVRSGVVPAEYAATPALKVVLTVNEDSPAYYANHCEISQTLHEFTMAFAKVPSRLTPEKLAEVSAKREIRLEAMLQVMIPPTLMPGLIKAFQIQLEQYEKINGKVKDHSVPQPLVGKHELN